MKRIALIVQEHVSIETLPAIISCFRPKDQGFVSEEEGTTGRDVRNSRQARRSPQPVDNSPTENHLFSREEVHLTTMISRCSDTALVQFALKLVLHHTGLWVNQFNSDVRVQNKWMSCGRLASHAAAIYALEEDRKVTILRPGIDDRLYFLPVMKYFNDSVSYCLDYTNFNEIRQIYLGCFDYSLYRPKLRSLILTYLSTLDSTICDDRGYILNTFNDLLVNFEHQTVLDLRNLGFIP